MDEKLNHENNKNSKNTKKENLSGKNDNQKPYRNERKESFSDVAKHLNTVENLISNNNSSYNNAPSKSLFTSSAQEIMFRRMHHISLNKPTSTSTSTSKNSHLKSEQKSENENENERNSTTR
jgi:hypothetical protein